MSRVRQTKKRGDGNVERYGKALDIVERDVSRLAFNVSDEGAM
jgi:hypothetical protein